MRSMDTDEIRRFLEAGTRTGKLATVRPDGRPHVAPIWFVLDGDDLVFSTWHESVKARNLKHDPRAALTVDLEQPPYAFVVVEGSVTISQDPGEGLFFATKIGARYMGEDRAEDFGRRNAVEGELLMRLRMHKVIGTHEMSA